MTGIKANKALKIAALVNTAYLQLAAQEFSTHELIALQNYEEFEKISPPDLLIWEEQEANAWVANHPGYHVIPQPSLGKEMLGYPIKEGDMNFHCYLETWLALKDNEGFKKQQYNLWILGQTGEVVPLQPRWSIVQNVLHWMD